MANQSRIAPEVLHAFMHTRRSVRRFEPKEVPRAQLERILDTARWAPSAHNRQPWRFVVVTSQTTKKALAHSMGSAFRNDLLADGLSREDAERQVRRSNARITQAPIVIILCLTMSEMDTYPDRKRRRAEFRMAMQSVALAGGQLLLGAHAEGLGAVWVCAPLFAQETVQEVLDLPSDWEPQGMVLLGYPEQIPAARERLPLDELVLYR